MREVIIYLIVFILTMAYSFYGERKTKLEPSRDEKEFKNRMLTVATALVIFIGFDLLVRWLLNFFV